MPQGQRQITLDEYEEELARRQGVPLNLLRAMTRQESGDNQNKVSGAGARGRYQLMPDKAQKYGINIDDPFDNVYGGIKYLKEGYDEASKHIKDEKSRWATAVAYYHGGPDALRQTVETGEIPDIPDKFAKTTTRQHVRSIMSQWDALEGVGGQPASTTSEVRANTSPTTPPTPVAQQKLAPAGPLRQQPGAPPPPRPSFGKFGADPVKGAIARAGEQVRNEQAYQKQMADIYMRHASGGDVSAAEFAALKNPATGELRYKLDERGQVVPNVTAKELKAQQEAEAQRKRQEEYAWNYQRKGWLGKRASDLTEAARSSLGDVGQRFANAGVTNPGLISTPLGVLGRGAEVIQKPKGQERMAVQDKGLAAEVARGIGDVGPKMPLYMLGGLAGAPGAMGMTALLEDWEHPVKAAVNTLTAGAGVIGGRVAERVAGPVLGRMGDAISGRLGEGAGKAAQWLAGRGVKAVTEGGIEAGQTGTEAVVTGDTDHLVQNLTSSFIVGGLMSAGDKAGHQLHTTGIWGADAKSQPSTTQEGLVNTQVQVDPAKADQGSRKASDPRITPQEAHDSVRLVDRGAPGGWPQGWAPPVEVNAEEASAFAAGREVDTPGPLFTWDKSKLNENQARAIAEQMMQQQVAAPPSGVPQAPTVTPTEGAPPEVKPGVVEGLAALFQPKPAEVPKQQAPAPTLPIAVPPLSPVTEPIQQQAAVPPIAPVEPIAPQQATIPPVVPQPEAAPPLPAMPSPLPAAEVKPAQPEAVAPVEAKKKTPSKRTPPEGDTGHYAQNFYARQGEIPGSARIDEATGKEVKDYEHPSVYSMPKVQEMLGGKMEWDNPPTPRQVHERMREVIAARRGELKPGEKLPSLSTAKREEFESLFKANQLGEGTPEWNALQAALGTGQTAIDTKRAKAAEEAKAATIPEVVPPISEKPAKKPVGVPRVAEVAPTTETAVTAPETQATSTEGDEGRRVQALRQTSYYSTLTERLANQFAEPSQHHRIPSTIQNLRNLGAGVGLSQAAIDAEIEARVEGRKADSFEGENAIPAKPNKPRDFDALYAKTAPAEAEVAEPEPSVETPQAEESKQLGKLSEEESKTLVEQSYDEGEKHAKKNLGLRGVDAINYATLRATSHGWDTMEQESIAGKRRTIKAKEIRETYEKALRGNEKAIAKFRELGKALGVKPEGVEDLLNQSVPKTDKDVLRMAADEGRSVPLRVADGAIEKENIWGTPRIDKNASVEEQSADILANAKARFRQTGDRRGRVYGNHQAALILRSVLKGMKQEHGPFYGIAMPLGTASEAVSALQTMAREKMLSDVSSLGPFATELQKAIDSAKARGDQAIVFADSTSLRPATGKRSLSWLKGTINHETQHVGQFNAEQGPHWLGMQDWEHVMKDQAAERAMRALKDKGYADVPQSLEIEMLAHLAANQHESLGLTQEEAMGLLDRTFRRIIEYRGLPFFEQLGIGLSVPSRGVFQNVKQSEYEAAGVRPDSGVEGYAQPGQGTGGGTRALPGSAVGLREGVQEGRVQKRVGSIESGTQQEVRSSPSKLEGEDAQAPELKAPVYYSALKKFVEKLNPKDSLTGEQWLARLKKPQSGVKPDEIKWTGLEQWFKKKQVEDDVVGRLPNARLITPAQIKEFLAQPNPTDLEMKVRGYQVVPPEESSWAALADKHRHARAYLRELRQAADQANFDANAIAKQLQRDGASPLVVEAWSDFDDVLYRGHDPTQDMMSWFNRADFQDKLPREVAESLHDVQGAFELASERAADRTTWEARHPDPNYRLQGGKNYTEIEFNLPNSEGRFGTHYGDKTVAHGRVQELTLPNGETVTNVAETQSDRHQKAQKKDPVTKEKVGYAPSAAERQAQMDAFDREQAGLENEMEATHEQAGKRQTPEQLDVLYKRREDLLQQMDAVKLKRTMYAHKSSTAPPPAPFEKQWSMLVLKRMLREAAERGTNWLAWDPGIAQVDRYSNELRRRVKKIEYRPNGLDEARVTVHTVEGRQEAYNVPLKGEGDLPGGKRGTLDELLGDKMAKQVRADIPEDKSGKFEGENLAIGGRGMEAHYDERMVREMDDYLKQWGAKVEDLPYGTREHGEVMPRTFRVSRGGKDVAIWLEGEHGVPGATSTAGWYQTDNRESMQQLREDVGAENFRALQPHLDPSEDGIHSVDVAIADHQGIHPSWMASFNGNVNAEGEARSRRYTLHGVRITPEMRNSVLYKGQPLFQKMEATDESGNQKTVSLGPQIQSLAALAGPPAAGRSEAEGAGGAGIPVAPPPPAGPTGGGPNHPLAGGQHSGANLPRKTTVGEKAQALHVTSHLVNPRFGIRNILGHVGLGTAESGLVDNVSALIDYAGTKSGVFNPHRQIDFSGPNQWKAQASGAWGQIVNGVQQRRSGMHSGLAFGGVEVSEQALKEVASKVLGNKLGTKVGGYIADSLYYMNQLPDEAMRRGYYEAQMANLNSLVSKGLLTNITVDELRQQATIEAEKAALQDKNFVSEGLKKFKSVLNGGRPFGVGDFIVKYTQIPGALVKRGIEYSPLGFIQTAYELQKGEWMMKKATTPKEKAAASLAIKFRRRNATRALARTLIGSGIGVATGVGLAALGAITPGEDDDDRVAKLNREQGLQNYALNMSALQRLVGRGFNRDEYFRAGDHKPKEGDFIMSIDWAQPWGTMLATGANIGYNAEKAGGLKKLFGSGQGVAGGAVAAGAATWESFNKFLEAISDTTVLKSLPRYFGRAASGRQDDMVGAVTGIMGEIAKDIPQSFTPQLLNQVRSLFDNTARETTDYSGSNFSGLKTAGMRSAAKLPGVSRLLAERKDTFGDTLKRPTDDVRDEVAGLVRIPYAGRAINAFLNPAYQTRYHTNPISQAMLQAGKVGGPPQIDRKNNETEEAYQERRQTKMQLMKKAGNEMVTSPAYTKSAKDLQDKMTEIFLDRVNKGSSLAPNVILSSAVESLAAERQKELQTLPSKKVYEKQKRMLQQY